VLIHRSPGVELPREDQHEPNAEAIFGLLEEWGWAGVSFEANIEAMLKKLGDPYHVAYHEGLDLLGQCLGATTTRRTDAGVPDVVWAFPDGLYFTFEAKTEKLPHGALSKKDLLEAAGHVNWVRAHLAESPATDTIVPIVVSPEPRVLDVGMPHVAGLYHLKPEVIMDLAQAVASWLPDMRVKYAGSDFTSVAAAFSAEVTASNGGVDQIANLLKHAPLEKLAAKA
jgi:hypothetical protein